jgi:hypothetical protein
MPGTGPLRRSSLLARIKAIVDKWRVGPGRLQRPGFKIVPQIITQNGGSLARDILRVKIEEKGTARRTAYRRIDEAEQTGLIKFCKGKNVYVAS